MRHEDWLNGLIGDDNKEWNSEPANVDRKGYVYPSQETQWLGFYRTERLHDGRWVTSCNTDGEYYVRERHSDACKAVEAHILRGHKAEPVYHYDYSGDPPF